MTPLPRLRAKCGSRLAWALNKPLYSKGIRGQEEVLSFREEPIRGGRIQIGSRIGRMEKYDLVVCGGGVIGLSIAFEAAVRGWKVAVLEAGEFGKESSWAGAGILPAGAAISAHDPIEQLRGLAHRLHPVWSEKLREISGIDNEFRECGGLYVAPTPAERATLLANRMWWEEHGIRVEQWSQAKVLEQLPGFQGLIAKSPKCDFWFVKDDCRLRNPRHLQALIISCERLGVHLRTHCRVEGWSTSNHRITAARYRASILGAEKSNADAASQRVALSGGGALSDRDVQTRSEIVSGGAGQRDDYHEIQYQEIQGDRFCVAAGAWTADLLEPLQISTGVLPVRGQMVLYRCETPPFPMVIHEGNRYLVPRDDGLVLAGSCEEEVGFNATTTPEMIDQLRRWAEGIWPNLARSPVEKTWAGLRPGSFDTFPYMGTLHPFENAYIASGHFRHGLHWSTATATLMMEWMKGETTSIDISPFCVQRGQSQGRTNWTATSGNRY